MLLWLTIAVTDWEQQLPVKISAPALRKSHIRVWMSYSTQIFYRRNICVVSQLPPHLGPQYSSYTLIPAICGAGRVMTERRYPLRHNGTLGYGPVFCSWKEIPNHERWWTELDPQLIIVVWGKWHKKGPCLRSEESRTCLPLLTFANSSKPPLLTAYFLFTTTVWKVCIRSWHGLSASASLFFELL